MRTRRDEVAYLSPSRLLEMLEFRFGAFEAIACAALELARKDPKDKLPMDVKAADASLGWRRSAGGLGGCGCVARAPRICVTAVKLPTEQRLRLG
jgi:hypothetical protein